MLEIYEQITGQTAADSVATELTKMIESVNRDHPETHLAQAVENGVAKAFEEGVRRHNWDLAKIQEKGASALKRFSQLDVVRDVFEDAKLHPSQLSIGVTPVQWSVNHLRRRVPSGQRVHSSWATGS